MASLARQFNVIFAHVDLAENLLEVFDRSSLETAFLRLRRQDQRRLLSLGEDSFGLQSRILNRLLSTLALLRLRLHVSIHLATLTWDQILIVVCSAHSRQ